PELWGGSADLAGSNNTTMKGEPSFLPAEIGSSEFSGDEYGRTLHFGIRQHGMGADLSRASLHGLTRPHRGPSRQLPAHEPAAARCTAWPARPAAPPSRSRTTCAARCASPR